MLSYKYLTKELAGTNITQNCCYQIYIFIIERKGGISNLIIVSIHNTFYKQSHYLDWINQNYDLIGCQQTFLYLGLKRKALSQESVPPV